MKILNTIIPVRYWIAFMIFMGFINIFGLRSSINVSLVELRDKQKRHNASSKLQFAKDTNVRHISEMTHVKWNEPHISAVISGFYWGTVIIQIPCGIAAAKYSAAGIFGKAVTLASLLNMFIPLACTYSATFAVFLRVLQGLTAGCAYPCVHGIWRHWAPSQERSRLVTFSYSGIYIGIVVSFVLSGFFIKHLGWEAPSIVYGVTGTVWGLLWYLTVYQKPGDHPFISPDEKQIITENTAFDNALDYEISRIPWRKMATSLPVHSVVAVNFARAWALNVLLVTPKYFKTALHFEIDESGILSALPHLAMAIVVPLGGIAADFCQSRYFTTTTVRKIFNTMGFGIEAALFLVIGYTSNATAAIILLIFAVGFSGFGVSGYNVNHLDIAPRFTSVLMGFSNAIANVSGILCPVAVVYLTKDDTVASWQNVFIIAALIHFAGILFYIAFASGEPQSWALSPSENFDMAAEQMSIGTDTASASFNRVSPTYYKVPSLENESHRPT